MLTREYMLLVRIVLVNYVLFSNLEKNSSFDILHKLVGIWELDRKHKLHISKYNL